MRPPVNARTVARIVAAHQTRPPIPITVEFRYDPADPYAVDLWFPSQRETWVLSRELLTDCRLGCEGPGGDVTVSPAASASEVRIELLSPAGHAVLWVDAAALTAFLDDTYRLVPAGTETNHIDWDLELSPVRT